MKINNIVVQFKRELWENRMGFLWAPLVFSCLLFVVAVWSVIEKVTTYGEPGAPLSAGDPGAMQLMTLVYQMVSCAIYLMSFAVVVTVYAHSTLFADRKSREILFWRSMPVSETTNVLTKLAMICIVVPVIMFIGNILGGFIFVLFLMLLNPAFSEFVEALKALNVSVDLLGSCFIVVLLMLPLIAWSLFCSAFARRSPVTISLSVPLGLWIADFIAQKYLAINLFFKDALKAYTQLTATSFKKIVGDSGKSIADVDLMSSIDLQMTSLALLFSVVMICAAIWLRNNRYEI